MNQASQPQILVPTDFSEDSENAQRYAASLGERYGASLHLLHVVTPHDLVGSRDVTELPDMGTMLVAADKAARERMDAGVAHGGDAEATVVRKVVRGVNAWEEIVGYAKSESIDMVIMAMGSGPAFARYLVGSVTEKVLRYAPCPVLVVEKGDRDFVDPDTLAVTLQRVVVADDLSDKTTTALSWAVERLRPYRPEVHMVHAVEFEVPTPYLMGGVRSVFTLDPSLSERVGGLLRERASEALPEGWTVVAEVREGRPHIVVPQYAAEIEADLLVVAGESQIDLGERVMGGTVERIARHAPCPMLVV